MVGILQYEEFQALLTSDLSHYETLWLSKMGTQEYSALEDEDNDKLGLFPPSPQSASGGSLSREARDKQPS